MSAGRPLRNISDTARWTATYRARETERPDALFRDPFARRLAGEHGEQIREQMAGTQDNEWAFVMRTYLFDARIRQCLDAGAPVVLNLAAGLDSRPYRMELPSGLQWIEVDLPELLAYKEEILAAETPRCALDRIAVDLADRADRRELLAQADRGLAVSEGLLIYLSDEQVAELGRDLADAGVRFWLFDLASAALVKYLQATSGRHTADVGAPYQFGPKEGVQFFEPLGWKPLCVDSVFETAMALGRVPKELLSAPPPPPGPDGPVWSGAVLLERA